MRRKARILNPVFLFLAISFALSQAAWFFKDMRVDENMRPFYTTAGQVDWWVRIVTYKIQILWLGSFAIFLGLRRERISLKTAVQIGIYFFTGISDIADWIRDGNRQPPYIDWIITLLLLISVEYLWDTGDRIYKKFKNGNGPKV